MNLASLAAYKMAESISLYGYPLACGLFFQDKCCFIVKLYYAAVSASSDCLAIQ